MKRFSNGEWIAIATVVLGLGGGTVTTLVKLGVIDVRVEKVETTVESVKDVHEISAVNNALLQDLGKRFEKFEDRQSANIDRLKEIQKDTQAVREVVK